MKLVFNIIQVVGLIWIGYWVYEWSSTKTTDPNGTSTFNKSIVRQYMLSRAAEREKLPIIIDAVSDTQRIKLHGEDLLTSAVSVQGDGLAQHYTIYFVTKPISSGNYLSGGADLLKDIDQVGFDAESDKIHEQIAQDDAKPEDPPLTRDSNLSVEAQAKLDAETYYSFKDNSRKIH